MATPCKLTRCELFQSSLDLRDGKGFRFLVSLIYILAKGSRHSHITQQGGLVGYTETLERFLEDTNSPRKTLMRGEIRFLH